MREITKILSKYWPADTVHQIIVALEAAQKAWLSMDPEAQARMARELAYEAMRQGSLSRVLGLLPSIGGSNGNNKD